MKKYQCLKIANLIDDCTMELCEDGFSYQEAKDFMSEVYRRAMIKYGVMNLDKIDKYDAESIIEDITIEFNVSCNKEF